MNLKKRYIDILETSPRKKNRQEELEQKGILITPFTKIALSHSETKCIETVNDLVEYLPLLPQEIWLIILAQLTIYDLCSISSTCKLMFSLNQTNWLWKRHYSEYFYGDDIHFKKIDTTYCSLKFNEKNSQLACTVKDHFLKRQDDKLPEDKCISYKKETIKRIYSLYMKNYEKMIDELYINARRELPYYLERKVSHLLNEMDILKEKFKYWIHIK